MKSSVKWIVMTILVAILFCGSFVYFYTKQAVESNSPTAGVEKKNENPLPEAKLFSIENELLSDDILRKGKVILIFVSPTCDACHTEGEFLKGLLEKRNDVKFYGVTSFGKAKESLESSEGKFPFKVLYDGDSLLAIGLGIKKVPIKIYLEDGIIKKVWGGATTDETKKQEFISWLEKV